MTKRQRNLIRIFDSVKSSDDHQVTYNLQTNKYEVTWSTYYRIPLDDGGWEWESDVNSQSFTEDEFIEVIQEETVTL